MTALATIDDLTDRLGRDVSVIEEIRLERLLEDASAAVRTYTGQQFLTADYTDRLPVRRNRARIPQRPVTAVDSVKDVNGVDVTFTWDYGDVVFLNPSVPDSWSFEPRRTPVRYVDVTYTAGYETVPSDIVAVVCSIAGRAFGISPEQAGVTALGLGDASMSFGAAGAAGGLGMLADERAVLDRYTRVGTSISLL